MGCKMPGPSEHMPGPFLQPQFPGASDLPLGGVLGRPVQIHKLGPRPQMVRSAKEDVPPGAAAPGGTSSVVERTTWG